MVMQAGLFCTCTDEREHPWVGAKALSTLSYRSCWLESAYRAKDVLFWLLSRFLPTQTIAALWPIMGPPCSNPYLSPQADFLDITQFCCLFLPMHNIFLDQPGRMDRFDSVFTLPGACFYSSTVVVEVKIDVWAGWDTPMVGQNIYHWTETHAFPKLRQTSIRNILGMKRNPKRNLSARAYGKIGRSRVSFSLLRSPVTGSLGRDLTSPAEHVKEKYLCTVVPHVSAN